MHTLLNAAAIQLRYYSMILLKELRDWEVGGRGKKPETAEHLTDLETS
jgi:hypothetical protein